MFSPDFDLLIWFIHFVLFGKYKNHLLQLRARQVLKIPSKYISEARYVGYLTQKIHVNCFVGAGSSFSCLATFKSYPFLAFGKFSLRCLASGVGALRLENL
jgi:hypothetical protein